MDYYLTSRASGRPTDRH